MRLNRMVPAWVLACLVGLAAGSARAGGQSLVTLTWTTPGDDSLSGVAAGFDLRYSTLPLTSATFALGTPAGNLPTPGPPGSTQSVTVAGLQGNTTYYFAIKTVDDRGNWSGISNIVVRTSNPVGVDDELASLDFSPAYPNPARSSTRFSYSLPSAGFVHIEAFDASGRLVRTLFDGAGRAGRTNLPWDLAADDGSALSAGIYFVRARLGAASFTRRVAIVH